MPPADMCVALDLPTSARALHLVDALEDAVLWYKVGPALFVSDGPALVRALVERGRRAFLDLKWHDIPSTVAGAVEAAAATGVSLATLHLAGGREMLGAAASSRTGSLLQLVGVGVLTSFTAASYGNAVGRAVVDVAEEQERLVRQSLGSGLVGFVCAVTEARALRRAVGAQALLVTPGIRRGSDAAGDQRRTATPAEAVLAGADLLVIGRPITGADDPRAAVRAIRAEMAA